MTLQLDWLRGCATALVTPFTADGAVDEKCLRDLVEYQIAKLQCRAGRRITFAVVMSFFDERCVTIDGSEERRGLFGDAVKQIYADGKVRAVDHRTRMFTDDLFCGRFMLLPTRRAFDKRDARTRAGFDVFQHCFANREIDRGVVTAQRLYQLLDRGNAVFALDHGANLVARLTRLGGNQLAHHPKSD